MKKNSIFKLTFMLFFFFFILNINVYAGSGNFKVSVNKSNLYTNGDTLTVDIYLTLSETEIMSADGILSYDLESLEYISHLGEASFNPSNGKFASLYPGLLSEGKNILSIKFKTKSKIGSSMISINNPNLFDMFGPVSVTINAANVSINSLPSSNNNLASLTVDGYNLSPTFNSDITSYKLYVNNSVPSINIRATQVDSKSIITGTGYKYLSFGDNYYTISCKSEDGNIKKYYLLVNKSDGRSKNNELSSLIPSEGILSSTFDPSNTQYSLSVPRDTKEVKFDIKTSDSKASYTILNNESLEDKESLKVSIKVVAENKSEKIYTINIIKEASVISEGVNNYLKALTPSVGTLSPSFDKENTNYVIWLPYENTNITFNAVLEDSKNSTYDLIGDNVLKLGNNKFFINVVAKDGSIRRYTINVKRGFNLNDSSYSNVKLKDIKITGGRLYGTFLPNLSNYFYSRGKNFVLEAIPVSDDAEVNIIDNKDDIFIIVKAPNGNIGFYTLKLKENVLVKVAILLLIFSFMFTSLNILYKKIIRKK